MRLLSLTLALAALSACDTGPPTDCKVVQRQARDCLKRFGTHPVRESLLACFPFSKPEEISGAWYVGFELNDFVEGEPPSRREIQPATSNTGTELWFVEPNVPVDGNVRVLQMRLVGRRSECPMYPGHIIIVDRVISRKLKVAPVANSTPVDILH